MSTRLLTTKRVRSIVKTAANRHNIQIKTSKTREYVSYSHMIWNYGKDVRRIEYFIGAITRENITGFFDEIDAFLALSGVPKVEVPYIYSNNTVRFKINAVIK
jgi:hypothetical protein